MARYLPTRLALVAALLGGAGACRQRSAEPDPAARGAEVPFTFRGNAALTFAYADLAGRFRTARSADAVPEASRRVVRVIDPTVPNVDRGDHGTVHVADLTRPSSTGEYTARPMPRGLFERRALAALPPGAASRVQIPGAGPELAGASPESHDQVILFGTSWCGACEQARAFFRDRQIDFLDWNVERDPEAAAELALRVADVGIVADRVPVIDVRGRLLVGFDQVRLATLLGEPI